MTQVRAAGCMAAIIAIIVSDLRSVRPLSNAWGCRGMRFWRHTSPR